MHSVTNIFIFLSMCKIFISLHGLQTHLRQNVVHSFVKDKMKSVFIFLCQQYIYIFFKSFLAQFCKITRIQKTPFAGE